MQGQLLDAQVSDFADIEIVLAAAVDGIDRAELFELLARTSELADDRPVELDLVDLAIVVDVVGRVRVRAIDDLVRSGRDAKRLGVADTGPLGLERAIIVEHLDALVA